MTVLARPLCREKQLQILEILLCPHGAGTKVPPFIFTHGLTATGKTHSVKYLLESKEIKHAVFHCVELYNIRLLFETILNKLTERIIKCDNICDFMSELKNNLHPNQVHVILFEESERFRDADSHLRQAFTRLAELTHLNICCIWESKIDWNRFVPTRGLPSPFILNFQQYTKPEIHELLVSGLPGERSEQFKGAYISMILPIFYFVSRSLTELLHIALVNYTSYCAPVESGECTEQESRKLWFNIEKQLNNCISTVNLREVESSQLKEALKAKDEEIKNQGLSTAAVPLTRKTLELPFYSKYLLISSYLASYNPQRTDKRFFVKHHGKQHKSSMSMRAKDKYNSKLTGPKPFPLERLLAIFYNITEERVNPTANIYSQITSLARLQLITAIGNDTLEQPKYRCNVDIDFVKSVSRTVQFDVHKYLYCQ